MEIGEKAMKCSLKTAVPSLAIAFALMLCVTDVMAQGQGRGGRQRGGRDRGGASENPQRLLQSEAVQNELEMTEEQVELLKELNEGQGQGRGQGVDREAMRAEMEGLSQEERMVKVREMRDSRSKEQLEKIGEILLPHQMDRLSQISAQASTKNGVRAFTSGTMAEKLNITDEQKESIQKRAEELQKEIAKLQAEMQEKLLEELTPEQREEYKTIVGESFTFEQRQRGGDRAAAGGRNRGQRGGAAEGRRGGNRGDRRGGRGGNRDTDGGA